MSISKHIQFIETGWYQKDDGQPTLPETISQYHMRMYFQAKDNKENWEILFNERLSSYKSCRKWIKFIMWFGYYKWKIDIHCTYTEDFDLEIFEKDLLYLSENYFVTVITNNILDKSPIEDICLKNGIRTQLLYIKKSDGKETLVSKYKDKKIITKWNEDFSKEVRDYYKGDM